MFKIEKPVQSLPATSKNTYITGSKYDPIFASLLELPHGHFLPITCSSPGEATKLLSGVRSLCNGVRRGRQLGLMVNERTGHVEGLRFFRDDKTVYIQKHKAK